MYIELIYLAIMLVIYKKWSNVFLVYTIAQLVAYLFFLTIIKSMGIPFVIYLISMGMLIVKNKCGFTKSLILLLLFETIYLVFGIFQSIDMSFTYFLTRISIYFLILLIQFSTSFRSKELTPSTIDLEYRLIFIGTVIEVLFCLYLLQYGDTISGERRLVIN